MNRFYPPIARLFLPPPTPAPHETPVNAANSASNRVKSRTVYSHFYSHFGVYRTTFSPKNIDSIGSIEVGAGEGNRTLVSGSSLPGSRKPFSADPSNFSENGRRDRTLWTLSGRNRFEFGPNSPVVSPQDLHFFLRRLFPRRVLRRSCPPAMRFSTLDCVINRGTMGVNCPGSAQFSRR